MRRLRSATCVLFAIALATCSSPEELRLGGAHEDVDPNASAEDLYFEMIELYSDGLLPEERLDALRMGLADIEDEGQTRNLIASVLRRTYAELRTSSNAEALVGREGRAYARRLYHAGLKEAQQYGENTVVVAGMLGIPTSKADAALMVGLPVGGAIVLKLGKLGLKRAAFLLRRLRDADDVLDHAKALGCKLAYVADREELRRVGGDAAVNAIEHVGAAGPRRLKPNPWNLTRRRDNCTACVTSVILNSLEGRFEYTAAEIERLFGYAGRERKLSPAQALEYIQQATGLTASPRPLPLVGENAIVGHYAVLVGWNGSTYEHVVYGRVTPTGRAALFDPQINMRMTYEELLSRYRKFEAYLLEAR